MLAKKVVILVVLTTLNFRFSLTISQLMAKAIPVRGAKFEKPAFKAGFLLLVNNPVSNAIGFSHI
ncbi:hypothetical protein [Enterobacter oligotrophicus]|uniref:hypothetical protein n=1 Tax=Enterobacter TaxID=547 RepID=UPI0028A70B88|nr:hypothetical protein [Enterobacter oligotrophicus]ELW1645468.1 hypothetical protein [Enterobacter oligotrophicus]